MNTWKQHGKIRKISTFASLIFVCIAVQSCRDLYPLDDSEPEWLGASIYSYLEEQGKFKYFLKVIDDLNYTEVLSKTGSKTLFAADDDAFIKGINDAWGLQSYEQLSDAQKKIILYNSMLDNAFLLEMMSSTAATSSDADPQEGRCLRQVTSANVVDTIGLYMNADLPKNNGYWDRFREKGIRLANDGTPSFMVHFLEEQLYQNDITLEDLYLLFNKRYDDIKANDAFIYDKRVIDQNVTCKNGYVHQVDGLIIPPSNMAEEIRRNPKTQLFSRLLDRFSIPVYNATLTADYNRLNHFGDDANSERVYEKRYFTTGSNRGASGDYLSFTDDDSRTQNAKGSLMYDPGWNSYKSGSNSQTSAEVDMGAMFVPNDETLLEYFKTGKGKALIERYGWRADGTKCDFPEEAMDSIPMDVIQALLRNVMKNTFNSTVPTKFESIMNDARENMKVYKEDIDEIMICNNGAVYVMNQVYSPARYVAVIAPVMLSEATHITYWAINQYEYDKYLLAMDSYFSLIVPADDAMRYDDPSTLKDAEPTTYIFRFDAKAKSEANKVYAETWTYDKQTGELLKQGSNLTNASQIKNLLSQMMEYYIVVGDFQDGNKYHMSKGYGTIKVEPGTKVYEADGRVEIDRIYGGHELEIDTTGFDTGVPVGEIYHQENGVTYRLDESMIQPATQSVYKVLSTRPEFSEFYKLCEIDYDIVELIGIRSEKGELMNDSIKRYYIFENLNGLDYNVRTFNTYHYTVYVPTNEAIEEAYDKGLPNWYDLGDEAREVLLLRDSVVADCTLEMTDKAALIEEYKSTGASQQFIDELQAEVDALQAKIDATEEEIAERSAVISKKTQLILDFVKYHIQDNSVYVDELPHCLVEGINTYYTVSYETATLDNLTKRFSKVTVETKPSNYSSHPTITVKGDISEFDNTCQVINEDGTEGQLFNIMTRDIEFSGKTIETSSYAVVHQIDNFLVNDRIFNGGKFTTDNE